MEGGPWRNGEAWKRKRTCKQSRGLKKKLEGPQYGGAKARTIEDKPARECCDKVLREFYKFFMEHSIWYFALTYLRHTVEDGKAALARNMKELIEGIVDTYKWRNERMKSEYTQWIEDSINDAMSNANQLVERFAQEVAITNSAKYEKTKAKL